jgi:hypothetical protein
MAIIHLATQNTLYFLKVSGTNSIFKELHIDIYVEIAINVINLTKRG